MLVLVGVLLLCIDIIKTALFTRGSVTEQLLSIVLLLALQAADVVASLVVSLQANGKDVYVSR